MRGQSSANSRPARVYRSELRTLQEAWARCQDGLAGRPVPKRRATSFGLSNQDIQLDGRRIRLRKLGWVRLKERLRWRGRVKTVRVSCEASRRPASTPRSGGAALLWTGARPR